MMNFFESMFGIVGLILIAIGFLREKGQLKTNLCGSVLMTIYALFIGDPIFILLQIVIVAVLTYRVIKEWYEREKDVST